MATTILRLPQLKASTGLSRSSIYKYIQDGVFPRPISLGPRSVGWLDHEIEAWIANKAASRDQHALRHDRP